MVSDLTFCIHLQLIQLIMSNVRSDPEVCYCLCVPRQPTLPVPGYSNKSPTLQRKLLIIWSNVFNVVFCEALSSRFKVALLIPSLRANSSCVSWPLRALRFLASFSDRVIIHTDLFTCEQVYDSLVFTYEHCDYWLRDGCHAAKKQKFKSC
jgi:hypothetical protein